MIRKLLGLPHFWRTLDNDSKWIWRFYFLLRLASTFYAYFVVSQMTQLGDTARYLDHTVRALLDEEGIYDALSTEITDILGNAAAAVFGKVLANLPFNFVATFGIYYSVNKLKPPPHILVFILFLLSMHSFATWTTVASKEAITVFGMGMVAGYLIDFDKRARQIPTLLELLGLTIVIIYKPQYMAAIVHIWFFLLVARTKSKEMVLGFAFLVLLIDIGFIWYFRQLINDLSLILYINFEDGGSSRTDFWQNDYDVFRKAPYGMLIAFWGPTFAQILEGKWTMAFAYAESLTIAMLLLGMLVYLVVNFRYRFVFIYSGIVLFFGWTWLLAVHYLSGALNAGSALRYRENFFAFFVVLLVWVYMKYKSQFIGSFGSLGIRKPWQYNLSSIGKTTKP